MIQGDNAGNDAAKPVPTHYPRNEEGESQGPEGTAQLCPASAR